MIYQKSFIGTVERGDIISIEMAGNPVHKVNDGDVIINPIRLPGIVMSSHIDNDEDIVICMLKRNSPVGRGYHFSTEITPDDKNRLNYVSYADVRNIRKIHASRVIHRVGKVDADTLLEMKKGVMRLYGINVAWM
ncbi:MAG: type II toxin-antitoxin system PemK/MazF family toxin [Anaerovoracaceae bacterium]